MTEGEFRGEFLKSALIKMSDVDNLVDSLNKVNVSLYDFEGLAKSLSTILNELRDKI